HPATIVIVVGPHIGRAQRVRERAALDNFAEVTADVRALAEHCRIAGYRSSATLISAILDRTDQRSLLAVAIRLRRHRCLRLSRVRLNVRAGAFAPTTCRAPQSHPE